MQTTFIERFSKQKKEKKSLQNIKKIDKIEKTNMKNQETQINIALNSLYNSTCWTSTDGKVKRSYILASVPSVTIEGDKLTLKIEYVSTSDKRNISKQSNIKEYVKSILKRWGCEDGINVTPVIHNEKAVLVEKDGHKCVIIVKDGLAYRHFPLAKMYMYMWYNIDCQDDILANFPITDKPEGAYDVDGFTVLGEKCYTEIRKSDQEVMIALVNLKGHKAIMTVVDGMIVGGVVADDSAVIDLYNTVNCKSDALLAFPANKQAVNKWDSFKKTIEVISEKNFN